MISACDAYFEKFPSKREKTKATDSVRRPVRSDYSSDHAYQTAQRGFDEVSRALRGEAPRQALQADFPMPPTGMRPRHNVVVAFNEAIKSAGERMRNMYAR
jgi:hypothetical protein